MYGRRGKSIRHGNHLQTKKQILQRINWEVMRIMLRAGYPRSKDNEEFCRILFVCLRVVSKKLGIQEAKII
jgi:hypothetical protein